MSSFIKTQQSLTVTAGAVGISWTGQAGYSFKDSKGTIYYVDPYFSNVCSQSVGYHRITPPPAKADEVITDYVLVTHVHRDHLDDGSLPTIADMNPQSMFIGPPSCISRFMKLGFSSERLIPIRRNQHKTVGNAVIKPVPAYHTADSVGYIMQIDGLVLYITGDTTYSDNLIEIADESPDMMMTCINGRLGCMNIPDAARLTGHIQPRIAVPMHYGMFKENTADPNEFIRQAEAYSGMVKGVIMEQGEWYIFSKEQGLVLRDR